MDKVNKEAIRVAKGIISKEINPNNGCAQLSELSQENNSPDELQIFELLAHEQYGHEHIGITAEDTALQITEECENFVNKVS